MEMNTAGVLSSVSHASDSGSMVPKRNAQIGKRNYKNSCTQAGLLVAVRGAATPSRLCMPRAVDPATGHRAGLARVLVRTPRVFLSMSSFMPWRLLATVLIRGKYSGLCHHQPPRHAANVGQ